MPGPPTGPFEGVLEANITDANPVVFNLGAWAQRMVEITNNGLGKLRFRFAADSEVAPDIVIINPRVGSFTPNLEGGQPLGAGVAVARTVPNGFTQLVLRADAGEAASDVIVSPVDLSGE